MPPTRRLLSGLAAAMFLITSGLEAQLAGPPKDIVVDAYDRGAIIHFSAPDGVGGGFGGGIGKYVYTRDGGDPVEIFGSPIVDSPLEPSTTYEYKIHGLDGFSGTAVTETATVPVTTRPAGEGITTTRLSQTADGAEGTRSSEAPAVSANGQFIVFVTRAPEFTGGSSPADQIVLLNRATGQFQVVSRNSTNELGNDDSQGPGISANGRYVVFYTKARNLAAVDTTYGGVYLFDAQTESLTLLSRAIDGGGPSRACTDAAISDDGSTAAFVTDADNLIEGSTDTRAHVYVVDLDNLAISRITGDGVSGSVNHNELIGAQEVGLNGDGTLVTYRAFYKNNFANQPGLGGHWLYDRESGETEVLTTSTNGGPAQGSSFGVADLTPDGRYAVFSYRTTSGSNGAIISGNPEYATVFLLDRVTGIYENVAIPAGDHGDAPVRPGGTTPTDSPTVSDDGRIVTFSGSNDLHIAPNTGTDVYARDRNLRKTIHISRSSLGLDGDGTSTHGVVAGDGSVVVYESLAANLVTSGGTNGYADLYASVVTLDPPDQNPPFWPGESTISATNLGATLVDLMWSAADDAESEVSGYRLYLDGELATTIQAGIRQFSITGLSPETPYTIKVEAIDQGGNESSTGPELEVVTKELVIGGAGLTGPVLEGGRSGLTWDPAEGNVAGYYVERRIGESAEWTEIAETTSGATSYSDSGLPASTEIAYRILVRFIGETEKNLHTDVHTITTPDLFISEINVSLPRSTNSILALAKEGTIGVELRAERNRNAQTTITYSSWPETVQEGTKPELKSQTIDLSEDTNNPGRYIGTWPLPDRTATLSSVIGKLTDGATATTTLSAPAFPISVASELSVMVSYDPGALADPPEILASIWSESQRAGKTDRGRGVTDLRLTDLPAGEDYHLKIYRDEQLREEFTGIALPPGLSAERTHTVPAPSRAGLRVAVRDPQGAGREGLDLTLEGDDQLLLAGRTNANGVVTFEADGRLFAGRNLRVCVSRTPWDLQESDFEITVPTEDTLVELELEWRDGYLPPGRVSGVITRPDGSTAAGAMIKAVGIGAEIDAVEETKTDSEGRYVIDNAFANTEVQAILDPSSQFSESATATVEVPSGGDVTLDIKLQERQKITVRVRGIEFVDASGRSLQVLDIRNLPTRDRVSAWIQLPGALKPQKAVTGDGDGLELTISLPRESPFTLTVEAPELGYEFTAIDLTAGDEGLIEIPMVTLFMDTTGYMVANLETADGEPLDPSTIWQVGILDAPDDFGGSLQWYFFGIGPRLIVPNLPQGPTTLQIYDGAYHYPDQAETFSARVQTVLQKGENDLGTIRMDSPGLLSDGLQSSISSHPLAPLNGDRVRVELNVSSSTTEISDIELQIDTHPSLTLIQDSVHLQQAGSADTTVTPTDSGFSIGDLEPGKGAHCSFDLQIDPDNENEILEFQIRASYQATGESLEESIGGGRIEVVFRPTLQGPESTPDRQVTLSGRAPLGKIRILDEEEIIAETRVSEYGYWRLETELTPRNTPYWHELTAVHIGADGEQLRTNPLWVLYNPLTPRPIRMAFRQPIEEANTPEEKELARRFPDVGDLTQFDVPASGVAKFWSRILGGVPFDFTVAFDHPDAVRDVSVKVDGPAGGIGRATLGDDGLFRARIQPRRDVRWVAGKISVQYTPLGGRDFPRWGNDFSLSDDVTIFDEDGALSASLDAKPAATAGTDSGLGVSYRVGEDIEGNIEARFRAEQPIPAQTGAIQYPYGSISGGSSGSGVLGGNVHWSLSGLNYTIRVEMTLPADRFVNRDQDAPIFPEESELQIKEATDSQLTLNWSRAIDDTWVEAYTVWLNNEMVLTVEGDQFEGILSDLVIGESYDVAIEARDAADRVTAVRLARTIEFQGAATTSEGPIIPPLAADQNVTVIIEVERPKARLATKAVKVLLRNEGKISNATTVADVFGWYKGVEGSDSQYERWDAMVDNIDSCGTSGVDLANLKQQITEATEADVVSNIASTTFTAASVGLAFTGAGIPAGLALEVAGLASGYLLGSIAEEEALQVEQAFAEAVANSEECEEEPECPPNVICDPPKPGPGGRDTADPTWKIDPSGFVYEVLEDNRLEGVTATLFEGESESGPWIVSDAAAFGEINPQVTPAGGNYRWDVPAGWWQVMVQKEGYATAYSEVLPVPPPHFNVNIPLKSLAPPEVTAVDSLNNGAAVEIVFANYIRADMTSPDTVRVRSADGALVAGQVYAPTGHLIDNPHTASNAKDITTKIHFAPIDRLTIGETYTVEVDGVIESYGEIPMGETTEIEVTIRDTFTGTWFGTFDGNRAVWTATVSEDLSITMEGYVWETGVRFGGAGTVGEDGTLNLDMEGLRPDAILTGDLSDGTLNGIVTMTGLHLNTVTGTRSAGEVAEAGTALTYHGAVIGSKTTTVTATVGPDGTTLVFIEGDLATTAVTANLDSQDRFSGFLSGDSELELDLSDPDGRMSGVLSLVDSGSWEVLGAVEGTEPSRLVNVSGRGPVLPGAGSLIAGFVIRGTSENPMLVRAIGPGLETFGLTGVLEQPRIRLVDPSRPVDDNLLAENTNWLQGGDRNELRAVFAGLGAFFLEDAKSDATVYLPIKPGPYTAVVQGIDGQAGIALVEAYDADLGVFGTTSEGVANLSLRGNVGSGSGVMIAGFVIDGGSPRRLLIRGVGPGLGPLGVQGFLADPTIALFDGNDPISDNQSWGDYLPDEGLTSIFQTVGAFPLESGSGDSAIVIWLAPGAYTVHLSNEVDGDGIGLIELYDLP